MRKVSLTLAGLVGAVAIGALAFQVYAFNGSLRQEAIAKDAAQCDAGQVLLYLEHTAYCVTGKKLPTSAFLWTD